MKYRRLGNTEVWVSPLCLGTMTWGEQNTEAQARQQLDYAVDQGINFIDTAELYPVAARVDTQGLTEQFIGRWLKQRGNREQMVLTSKVSSAGEIAKHIRGGPRLTRPHIEQAIEASLQRLQTDYIDLYQLHWPDRQSNFFGKLGYVHQADEVSTPLLETLQVLGDLVTAGKIRYIGVANETPWGVMTLLNLAQQYNLPRIVSVQNPYNLLNRVYEIGLAEIGHRENISLLAYSPLAFGTLTGKYLGNTAPPDARLTLFERFNVRYSNEFGRQAIAKYVALAQEYQLSPAQMALAYVTSRPFLTSAITGATQLEQLQSNINSLNITLSDEILHAIEHIHQYHPNPCP